MSDDRNGERRRRLDEECPHHVVLPRRQLLEEQEIMKFLDYCVGTFDMYVEDDYGTILRSCSETNALLSEGTHGGGRTCFDFKVGRSNSSYRQCRYLAGEHDNTDKWLCGPKIGCGMTRATQRKIKMTRQADSWACTLTHSRRTTDRARR